MDFAAAKKIRNKMGRRRDIFDNPRITGPLFVVLIVEVVIYVFLARGVWFLKDRCVESEYAGMEEYSSPNVDGHSSLGGENASLLEDFIYIEGGWYLMGQTGRFGYKRERPPHKVYVDGFIISRYEVTFDSYDRYCEDRGVAKPDDEGAGRGKHPVINVSWNDAVQYCNWLSEQEGLPQSYSVNGSEVGCDFSSPGYRLPTEAEWEYAARGGQYTWYYAYSGSPVPDTVCWYRDNSEDMTHIVGEKEPNELGLYDMCGNAGEFCWDYYKEDFYTRDPVVNPIGPAEGRQHTVRGGNVRSSTYTCTVSYREEGRKGKTGFRVVRTSPKKGEESGGQILKKQ